jgi:transposase InsO family protein
MAKRVNQVLARHYFNPNKPGAFGGVSALQRSTKLPRKTIAEWLAHQDTYTLHKPIRRKFTRQKTITGGIDHQFQADLIDMRNLRKYNKGVSYLLTCIDVFSKFAWAIPIKSKTGKALVEAVGEIFASRKPFSFQSDRGSEFRNKSFLKFLRDENVHFFTTENEDVKAAIVERFNRTLKEKMWRYFTKTNKLEYLLVLPRLMKNYNSSYHRSIRMAPLEVTRDNQEDVWNTLYGETQQKVDACFKIGDLVRIAQAKQTFKKGYTPAWMEELFTIKGVNKTIPVTYELRDAGGDDIAGSFYKEELQRVGGKQVFRIEKVLQERRRGRGGREKEYLVKWFGYNSSFNSWVSDISRYKD